MLNQASSGCDQSLLQARQGPVPDSLRPCQPPPKVAQVIGDDGQPQPDLVRPEPVTTEPRHLHCLLSFFDPLLRCPPFVVKPYHRLTRKRQVRHNEPDSRVQLSQMMLYLRHHPSGRLPSGCLVQQSLVFDQRFLAGPAHRARHQFGNISFQVVVRRNANGVLHAPLLQRLIDLRFGEGGVGTKHHLLAQRAAAQSPAGEVLPSPRHRARFQDGASPPDSRRLD